MKSRDIHRGIALLALLFCSSAVAAAPITVAESEDELERVTLCLKWYHQFQFAGYYAAQQQGFYRDEGLDVVILEGTPEEPPQKAVLAGRADFGVSDSSIVLSYLKGQPVVVLAAIFQHSPYILLTRADRGFRSPFDLVGRKIMLSGSQGEGELLAMFLREGIEPSRLQIVPHSWNNDDLIEGRVDAISAYATVEVSQLRQRGIEPYAIHAREYGVDFYGDVLFTTAEQVRSHRGRVERFTRASLKGWEYAMSHPEELIELISQMPGVRERGITRDNLAFEAQEMKALILADIVEMGHMNPGRWDRIAQTFVDLGVAKRNFNLDRFLYDPEDVQLRDWMTAILVGIGLAVAAAVTIGILDFNLRRMVQRRTRELREEIAQREKTEQALRASELRNRVLLESIPDVIFRIDRQGKVVDFEAGPDATARLHLEDMRGRNVSDRLNEETTARALAAITSAFETNETQVFEFQGGKHPREYEARIVPTGNDHALAIVRDVTEEKRRAREEAEFDRQLLETQKLESLGILAGGIAHDFNNLLTGILGNASLAKTEKRMSPAMATCLDQIEAAAGRAADLCKQMLAYSGRGRFVVQNLDLNEIVREMTQLLKFSISKKSELEYDLDPQSLMIFADGSQIQQIVMNLVVNASEALDENGGKIILRTRKLQVSEEQLQSMYAASETKPGEFVSLEVIDDGCGMSEETLGRLFDPFFTTKFTGRGLGLAAVLGIVRGHHGAIRVESNVGSGTTFQLLLPTVAASQTAVAAKLPARPLWHGSGRILVVDDEEYVRQVTSKMLGTLGFEVVDVSNGQDAVWLVEEEPDGFRLVILDLTMPHPDGIETFVALRRLSPCLPVIMVSGYTDQELKERFSGEAPGAFLQKPFRRAELIEILQSVLRDDYLVDSIPEKVESS